MAVANAEISRWLLRQYGPGKRHRSARQLALAAGLSEAVVSKVIERGSATADSLIKIARACGADSISVLVMAGWLKEGEGVGELSREEASMLRVYRQLSPASRRLLREVGEGLLVPEDHRQ